MNYNFHYSIQKAHRRHTVRFFGQIQFLLTRTYPAAEKIVITAAITLRSNIIMPFSFLRYFAM